MLMAAKKTAANGTLGSQNKGSDKEVDDAERASCWMTTPKFHVSWRSTVARPSIWRIAERVGEHADMPCMRLRTCGGMPTMSVEPTTECSPKFASQEVQGYW